MAGGALLALTALPTAAATVVATYTGTVADIYDVTGVFGGDTSDPTYDPYGLTGQTFALTYTFDTTVGRETNPGVYDQVYGGSSYYLPDPLTSVELTFNGVTQSADGNYYSTASTNAHQYYMYAQDYLHDETVDQNGTIIGQANYEAYINAYFSDPDLNLPADLERPFSLDTTGLVQNTGSFSFYETSYLCTDAAATDCARTAFEYAFGSLLFDSLIVTVDGVYDPDLTPDASIVPLPASAWLLVAGIGSLGAASKRRRKAA